MIQGYLIAAVQNMRILIANDYKPQKAGNGLMHGVRSRLFKAGRDMM